ncbi:hypothetical protein [Paraburkholderia sp. BL23I1N1]|uniref:hypothetical protein n=1 Tax=Paraburkholderia sp. BL23I1N1 TaxID=1938802 RepID=UPI0011C3FBD2|nr:hypothetical protein [Paraburkholderia sp. BL23I1N1]
MRGGYLERQDAAGREFAVQNHEPDLRHTVSLLVSPVHLSLPADAVADDLVHRGFGDAAADRQTLAIPDEPTGAVDFSSHRLPFQCGDHLAAEHGPVCRLKLHLYVELVEDPAASQLAALDGLLKFTSVLADHGHAFIARHTVSTHELIGALQPR